MTTLWFATQSVTRTLIFCACLCLCARPLHAQPDVDAPNVDDPRAVDQSDSPESGDARIQQSLQELFTSLPGLHQVSVDVTNGTIILRGEVNTVAARDQAVRLAELAQGANGVANSIVVEADVRQRLTGVWNNLRLRAIDTVARLPLLLIAGTVVALFWLLSRLVTARKGLYRRITRNPFLQSLLRQITAAVMVLIGFVLALEILDATAMLGTILGAAGILGLAVGFAIRDTVENFLASILLSIRQPFDPRDHIVIEGYEGKVVKLTSRETVLMTLEGNHVRIPNATVYKGVILNYSRNSLRQFSFEVGIDMQVDIRSAICLAIETMNATPGVIDNPPANCLVQTLGDSNVVLLMLAWTDQKLYDFGKVRSETIKNVKEAFDAAGFDMPEPIYRLRIQGGSHQVTPLTTGDPVRAEQAKAREHRAQIDQTSDVSAEHYLDEQITRDKANDSDEDLLQK